MIITHIVKRSDWEQSINDSFFSTKTLKDEGFIHCSNLDQVCKVADYNFKNQSDLVILVIDTLKLVSNVVWEDLYDLNETYPHIYGVINKDSILGVYDFKYNDQGYFELSDEVENYTKRSK